MAFLEASHLIRSLALDLSELAATSGDSTLVSMLFDGREAVVEMDHAELEKRVRIRIETNLVYTNLSSDHQGKTCLVLISSLKDVLHSKNGVFVPAEDFGTFMKEVKEGLHLAYGLRTRQYGFVFSLVGEVDFVAIFRSFSDVLLELSPSACS